MPGPSQPNLLHIPGQVNVTRMDLISHTGAELDILNIFQSMEIYEDMFSSTLSGEILLVEALNLVQHFPIVGKEYVRVEFSTPSCPPVKVFFAVYKVSPRAKFKSESSQLYTLHLCSPEALVNSAVKIQKSYHDMEYHEMVKRVWTEYLSGASGGKNQLQYSQTTGKFSIVAPSWTPFQFINMVASRALYDKNPFACNFMFYQDLDSFKFVPLDQLFAQNPSQNYFVSKPDIRNQNQSRDATRDMKVVQDYGIGETWDRLQHLGQGAFSGSLFIHDITNKGLEKITYGYFDTFDNTNHLGKFPLIPYSDTDFSRSNDSVQYIVPSASYKYLERVDNEIFDLNFLQRKAFFSHLHSIQITITVPGDSRRRVGEVVTFEVPSPEVIRASNKYQDEYLSGKFLITSINHSMTKTDYLCHMELSKESVEKPIPDVKDRID